MNGLMKMSSVCLFSIILNMQIVEQKRKHVHVWWRLVKWCGSFNKAVFSSVNPKVGLNLHYEHNKCLKTKAYWSPYWFTFSMCISSLYSSLVAPVIPAERLIWLCLCVCDLVAIYVITIYIRDTQCGSHTVCQARDQRSMAQINSF